MVLNLSDQDSSHHSPHEGRVDNASVPSPEARMDISHSPIHRPGFPQRDNGLHRAPSREQRDIDNNIDAPIDFSVRRQESDSHDRDAYRNDRDGYRNDRDGYRSDSNSESMEEWRAPNGLDRRRSSEMSEPLSPRQSNYRPDDKIGEPRLALPGLPPGMQLPHFPGQLPPGFPMNMMAHFNMVNNLSMRNAEPKNVNSGQNDKSTARPFKAYPKDPLSLPLGYFGLPGVAPLPGIDMATAQAFQQANSEEMFKQYRDYVVKRIEHERQDKRKSPVKENINFNQQLSPVSPSSPLKITPQMSPNAPPILPAMSQPQWPQRQCSPPRPSQPSVITPNPLSIDIKAPSSPDLESMMPDSPNSSVPPRKRSRSNSDGSVLKDGAYWERRRKNNEAAKRSRDSRRAKEDEIAIRAAYLEQENLKLRVEVTALKNETAKLRCMLFNS